MSSSNRPRAIPAPRCTGTPPKTFGTITVDKNGNVIDAGGNTQSTAPAAETAAPAAEAPAAGTKAGKPDGTAVAALPSTNNPEELYRNSYQFILSGDYSTAEQGFRDHIARFPKDAKAADAHYWLGESLLGQQKYRDAAEAFLAASKDYPKAKKAPDMLLKLGVSLVGLKQTRCRLRHFRRDRQALSRHFRRAQGTRQAGKGARGVLVLFCMSLPQNRDHFWATCIDARHRA